LEPQSSRSAVAFSVQAVRVLVPARSKRAAAVDANGPLRQPLRQDYTAYVAKCQKTDVPANQLLADQFRRPSGREVQATKIASATKFPVPCAQQRQQELQRRLPQGRQCRRPAAVA